MSNLWQTSTSGLKGENAPIALNFSIPEQFSQSNGTINLIDPSTVEFKMSPPLIIPQGCCADLVTASFAYTQPNIGTAADGLASIPNGNNRVSINFDGGGYVVQSEIILPTGLYSYTDVQYALNAWAITAGWIDPTAPSQQLFVLTGIASTQTIVLTLDPAALAGSVFPAGGILVNFVNPSPFSGLNNSLGDILGFSTAAGAYPGGGILTVPGGGSDPVSFLAPMAANFAETSAYVLYCSLVTNSYANGLTGNILYSFPLGGIGVTNSVISYQSTLRFPVQITSGTFSSVRIWTTDQNGNRLPWVFYQAPFQFQMLISRNKADGSV